MKEKSKPVKSMSSTSVINNRWSLKENSSSLKKRQHKQSDNWNKYLKKQRKEENKHVLTRTLNRKSYLTRQNQLPLQMISILLQQNTSVAREKNKYVSLGLKKKPVIKAGSGKKVGSQIIKFYMMVNRWTRTILVSY